MGHLAIQSQASVDDFDIFVFILNKTIVSSKLTSLEFRH